MYVFYFNWFNFFNFLHLIKRNLSVRCASSCGDTFTQTIASTSFQHFCIASFLYWFRFLIFDFIFSMDSFFIIHFKRLFLDFICLLFYSISDLIWFYSFIFLFMFITFIFTHSNFFRSRYNLDFIIWHCCPLLFKVDKICSYSYFIRNI